MIVEQAHGGKLGTALYSMPYIGIISVDCTVITGAGSSHGIARHPRAARCAPIDILSVTLTIYLGFNSKVHELIEV